VKELIECLNDNQGAIMVIITFVYVIATIAICIANIRSAKASKDQLEESKRQFLESQKQAKAELEESKKQFEESKRQFAETNRPIVTCQYILESKTFCGIRILNYGNRPASKVTFKINDEFLNVLPEEYKIFAKLNEAEYHIGINQHYDFFFSDIERFKSNKAVLIINIQYEDDSQRYSNTITIDFTKQLPEFTVDDYKQTSLKEIQKELKRISNGIAMLSKKNK